MKGSEKNGGLIFSNLELGWSRRYLEEAKISLESYLTSEEPRVNEKLALSLLKLKQVLTLLGLENVSEEEKIISSYSEKEENFSSLIDSLVGLLLTTNEKSSLIFEMSRKILDGIEQILDAAISSYGMKNDPI